ncbi:MAG: hypothetical protein HYV97_06600 [Bdellovibrio sp.]|nr:hypothetical protein [Bdellovibrio sp.]
MQDKEGNKQSKVLFMALGMAIASVSTLADFAIMVTFNFFLFAAATYLKERILQESSKQLQVLSDSTTHPFLFLGEEIESYSAPTSRSHGDRDRPVTPDERYIILASPNLHLKRIIFCFLLTAIHFFFLHKLAQQSSVISPLNIFSSGILCLTTLWIFFRIWQKGQFQLVMFANWCGVIILTKAPTTLIATAIPVYMALSFHILQEERENFGKALWATSWSYSLKFCALWWLCLLLMGSMVPENLFQSLNKTYHKLNRFMQKDGLSTPSLPVSYGPTKQSLQQLSSSLSMPQQISGESSSDTSEQWQQFTKLQSQAQDLIRKIDQKSIPPDQLSRELQNLTEELEQTQISSDSLQKTITELQSHAQQLANEVEHGALPSELNSAEPNQISRGNTSSKNVSLPTNKKEIQVKKSWERYKNLLFKIAMLILILFLAKLFEKRSSQSQERESSQVLSGQNFKKKWKNLLAQKLDSKSFVVEAYQLLAEANQAFLITEKPFCPPFVIYPDIPSGIFQKEWPIVANAFLKTFYGQKSVDRNEFKLFTNSADRLFSVYFTKSLDQAITKPNENT